MNRSKYLQQKNLFEKRLLANLSESGTNYLSPSSVRAYINYTSDFLFYLRENFISEEKVKRTDIHCYMAKCKASGDSPKLINRKVAAVKRYSATCRNEAA